MNSSNFIGEVRERHRDYTNHGAMFNCPVRAQLPEDAAGNRGEGRGSLIVGEVLERDAWGDWSRGGRGTGREICG